MSPLTQNMKQLKFSEPLPELILRGDKTTTWRIADDKDIEVRDVLSLCDATGEEFGVAEVLSVKETTFGELSEDDKQGHEQFHSEQGMYDTYSKYYDMDVTPRTRLKVIKFMLI